MAAGLKGFASVITGNHADRRLLFQNLRLSDIDASRRLLRMLDDARLRAVSVRVQLADRYPLIALAWGECLLHIRLDRADRYALDFSFGFQGVGILMMIDLVRGTMGHLLDSDIGFFLEWGCVDLWLRAIRS